MLPFLSSLRRSYTCRPRISRRLLSINPGRAVRIGPFTHDCGVDAEPLQEYRPGGYHPVHIGDILKDGRYKILHKLGWGGYSTVWAARDQIKQQFVALKIAVSETRTKNREERVLSALSKLRSSHPGSQHIMSIVDHFQLKGPNGTHKCLVLELLGENIPDLLERRFNDERLPGPLAKRIAKQALTGLDYLHRHGITHGDLHTRNLVLAIPTIHALSEEAFMQKLRAPETGPVTRKDGNPLEANMPRYLMYPTYWPTDRSASSQAIKIVDFGEAFVEDEMPETLHTPLVVRAPEVVFRARLDYRVDLWAMGCVLFELVAGQPPFDGFMINPTSLVCQMRSATGEDLPKRWHDTWNAMREAYEGELYEVPKLQDWLEDVYFDEELGSDVEGKDSFTREDIVKVGELIKRLLRFEPSERAEAREILQDPWFRDDKSL